MRKVIAFRATAHQHEVLSLAEQIFQEPACKIITRWVECELPAILKTAIRKGITPKPFTPPIQRTRKKNAKSDPC
jgi:hypothetical protein